MGDRIDPGCAAATPPASNRQRRRQYYGNVLKVLGGPLILAAGDCVLMLANDITLRELAPVRNWLAVSLGFTGVASGLALIGLGEVLSAVLAIKKVVAPDSGNTDPADDGEGHMLLSQRRAREEQEGAARLTPGSD
jgi:hypothetical protein